MYYDLISCSVTKIHIIINRILRLRRRAGVESGGPCHATKPLIDISPLYYVMLHHVI